MSANWARRLTRWPAHREAGQLFDVTHLHPFRYPLMLAQTSKYPAREVDVRVGFSSHTFTKSCEYKEDPHAAYSRENDPRIFCQARYALSKRVPDVIRKLDGRDCLHGNRENYLVIGRRKSKPRHGGGVRTPILLVIPRLVRTLAGGQTRFRLMRHSDNVRLRGGRFKLCWGP